MPRRPPTPADVDLRSFRALWGLTQEQAANAFGLSLRSYIRYENGDSPHPRLLQLAIRGLTAELAKGGNEAVKRHEP